MIGILKIAAYICERYRREYGVGIDEMKLHKLLYFVQRECIVQTGKPITGASFEAWKYGPVSPYVHNKYLKGDLGEALDKNIELYYQKVFDTVFEVYAPQKAWSLSILSHGELSWQIARGDTPSDMNSSVRLKVEDIAKDADRVRLRRYIAS